MKSKSATLIFVLSFVYAIVRYHVFHEVPWAHFPLFIANKAISLSGLVFLGMALVQQDKLDRKAFGQWGAALIGAHILISFLIMNEHYFAKFFIANGEYTFQAELSMLAGVIGAIFMCALLLSPPSSTSGHLSLRLGWGRAILICAAVHLAFMGYTSWLAPEDWPGYMPPITLISLIVAVYFFVRRRKST